MKKYLSLIVLLFLALGVSAQETEPLPAKGEVIVEKREEFTIPGRSKNENGSKLDISFNPMFTSRFKRSFFTEPSWKKGHWAGIGIYYNGLIDNLGALSTPSEAPYMSLGAKSIGVTLNPFSVTLIHGKRMGLLTGMGLEFNNFRFDQNVTLKRENGITGPDWQYQEKGVDLTKSKLFTCYMNIPLLMEIQIGHRQKFFINAGMVGGLNLGSHTKVKADSPQFKGTEKNHGSLGLRNFHYGYVINIGYDCFALSVTYYRSNLFRPGQGPHAQQINVGLSLML